jgi:gluconate 2-dehydrogenase gamma chain
MSSQGVSRTNTLKKAISRRDILKTLGLGAMAGPVLNIIPAQAAEYAHHMISAEKAASPGAAYIPKCLRPEQYKTLQALCQTIIPPEADSGGAIEAGAPEFIDLLSSENPEYQLKLGGGLMWLDETCTDRYGKPYLHCAPAQQKEILDRIAYRKNELTDPDLSQGISFFSFLRSMTADAFFTSAVGIKYLGYIGNTYLTEFQGCPPVPEV